MALSGVVVYAISRHFKGFADARERSDHRFISSLDEDKAYGLAKKDVSGFYSAVYIVDTLATRLNVRLVSTDLLKNMGFLQLMLGNLFSDIYNDFFLITCGICTSRRLCYNM